MQDATHEQEREGFSVQLEISNAMVKLYKDLFGRGPTKTRTDFAGPDLIVTTLENTFTPAERALVRMGELQRMRDTRMYFQYAIESDFREAVEQITGRKVRGFVSGLDAANDIASELFYLEPRSG